MGSKRYLVESYGYVGGRGFQGYLARYLAGSEGVYRMVKGCEGYLENYERHLMECSRYLAGSSSVLGVCRPLWESQGYRIWSAEYLIG